MVVHMARPNSNYNGSLFFCHVVASAVVVVAIVVAFDALASCDKALYVQYE